jgi:dTDP-4-amino-4,6-dideoxygalactose transaminase
MHAAVALESLRLFDGHLLRRRAIARRYADGIAAVPGLTVQHVDAGDLSTWKDFTVAVDRDRFGVGRDVLARVLRAEGVDTRTYFDPPVHQQKAYVDFTVDLPVTERAASRALNLPIYPSLADQTIDRVVDVLRTVHEHAGEVASALSRPS